MSTAKKLRFDEQAIPLRRGKRPEWCAKPRPCDFDPPSNHCPERRARSVVFKIVQQKEHRT